MIIKKGFNKAPFTDNPYKDSYYIDMNGKNISVYEKIENNSFFSFLDRNVNNRYNFIGSRIYEFDNNVLMNVDKLKKEVFVSPDELNYFKLSNLNFLNKIIDDMSNAEIIRKDKFLDFLYLYDLNIRKLSYLFTEKCDIGFSKKLEHSKEMKIAGITGNLSGSFLYMELILSKEPVRKIRTIVDTMISEYNNGKK